MTEVEDTSADTDVSVADAEPDVGGSACAAIFDPGLNFDIDFTGEKTQIHADAVFDGEFVWLVYNSRGANGENFDLWMVQISCGASPVARPQLVADSGNGIIIEPQIARGGDGTLLVVWQLDDQSGSDNLSLWSRAYDTDASPIADGSRLPLFREGEANLGNAWMAALEPRAGGFALAGAWAHPEAERFQVFAQSLDPSGRPIGDAIDLELEPTTTQVFPALAVGDSDVAVMWERQPDEGEAELRGARVDLASGSVSQLQTFAESAGAAVAFDGQGYVWAGSVGGDIQVWSDGGEVLAELGTSAVDVAPVFARSIAGTELGVVWYRQQSGSRFDVATHVQPVGEPWEDSVGRVLSIGETAAPYSPVIVPIDGGWFYAWSGGTSPLFEIRARFESE
ncbi:MAG: hypothetical protein ACJAYU_000950 [Bradymonadia bacterium]